MLNGESALSLAFVKKAKDHFGATDVMAIEVKLRVAPNLGNKNSIEERPTNEILINIGIFFRRKLKEGFSFGNITSRYTSQRKSFAQSSATRHPSRRAAAISLSMMRIPLAIFPLNRQNTKCRLC